jgi:hypothetical protein
MLVIQKATKGLKEHTPPDNGSVTAGVFLIAKVSRVALPLLWVYPIVRSVVCVFMYVLVCVLSSDATV